MRSVRHAPDPCQDATPDEFARSSGPTAPPGPQAGGRGREAPAPEGRSWHYAKHVSAAGQGTYRQRRTVRRKADRQASARHYAKDVDRLATPGADVRESRRHVRYAQREVLWGVSRLDRIRACGRVPVAPKGEQAEGVRVRVNDGIAHYAGLASCGSTWGCTVCEPNIANERAGEISQAAAAWDRAGNSVFMVTLTVSHHFGLLLAVLMAGISAAFRFLIGGRPWRALKAELDVAGTIRSMEVTWGRNGWHPHLHVLVFLRGDPGADGLWKLTDHFQRRWKFAAVKHELGEPDDEHGVKVERCYSAAEAGAYIAKTAEGKAAGNEIARGDLKTGRKDNLTPFQVLERFRQLGDLADLKVWHEYEKATKGHQKITWSKGLRAEIGELADLGEERSDEEIAAQEVGGEDVVVIPVGAWRRVVAVPGLCGYLLSQAEQGGAVAVVVALRRYGIRVVGRGS